MPELPEVETIRRDLESLILGKKILGVSVRDAKVLTGILPNGGPRWNVKARDFEKISKEKRSGHFTGAENIS